MALGLSTTRLAGRATDVALEGLAGTGESLPARALGKRACERGVRTPCVRTPDMLALRDERLGAGWPERRAIDKRAPCKAPALDEFLMDRPDKEQTRFLPEPAGRRYDTTSAIFRSRHSIDERRRGMGGGAHAESVMDRVVHNATRVPMGDADMRERAARKE